MDNHGHSQKKKYQNIAQGSCKWEEGEKETANWRARNQVNRHTQWQKSHFLNPIIVYKNISSVQLKQNDADRVNSACIGWEKPARGVLQSSVFRDAILGCSSPPLSHPARGWTSRGLAGVCLHTSINITKIMLVHRPFEEILPIVAAVMIA